MLAGVMGYFPQCRISQGLEICQPMTQSTEVRNPRAQSCDFSSNKVHLFPIMKNISSVIPALQS